MNINANTSDAARADILRYELDALRALASRVINEHTADGTGWPCQLELAPLRRLGPAKLGSSRPELRVLNRDRG